MCERVDLVVLRKRAAMIREHEAEILRLYRIQFEEIGKGYFCDECGRIAPPCNFYPLGIHGPDSVSGLVCNDCRRKEHVLAKL